MRSERSLKGLVDTILSSAPEEKQEEFDHLITELEHQLKSDPVWGLKGRVAGYPKTQQGVINNWNFWTFEEGRWRLSME